MQKLIEGLHAFQQNVVGSQRAFFESLAHGQSPEVLFITCSDSRINPNLLTQTGPGELFIVRNAGNIVPPHGQNAGGEAGTIEYAVAVLKVKHVVICGHSHCGAMQAVLDPRSVDSLPAVASWIKHSEAVARIMTENYKHLEGPVLVQLEHLRTLPAVASAIARGELTLHGWVYKLETGEAFSYDPERRQFLPAAEAQKGIVGTRPPALATI
jgi:carbonic anhydrase